MSLHGMADSLDRVSEGAVKAATGMYKVGDACTTAAVPMITIAKATEEAKEALFGLVEAEGRHNEAMRAGLEKYPQVLDYLASIKDQMDHGVISQENATSSLLTFQTQLQRMAALAHGPGAEGLKALQLQVEELIRKIMSGAAGPTQTEQEYNSGGAFFGGSFGGSKP